MLAIVATLSSKEWLAIGVALAGLIAVYALVRMFGKPGRRPQRAASSKSEQSR